MIPISPSAIVSAPELPGFEWVRPLGSGGFVGVHLYHQPLLSRDVAIKVAHFLNDEQGAAELRRETNAMATVTGHPAIVPLRGAGTAEDGRPFLMTEYCPVVDMGEQMRARPMSIDQALNVMVQISGGVEVLRRTGIVHRDIKPANIMLDLYGRPIPVSFGVASPVGVFADGILDDFFALWAPLEQQDQRTHIHPAQGVWALASTTQTLLMGRSPFEGPFGDNSAVAVASRVRSGRIRGLGRADVPEELGKVLFHVMRLDPLERTPCAAEFGWALQGVQRLMGRPVTHPGIRDPYPEITLPPSVRTLGGATALEWPDERGLAQAGQDTRLCSFPLVDLDRMELCVRSLDFDSGVEAHIDMWREPRSVITAGQVNVAQGDMESRRVSMWGVSTLVVVAAMIVVGSVIAMLTGKGQRVSVAPGPIDQGTGALDPVNAPPAPATSLLRRVEDGRATRAWIGVEESRSDSQSEPGPRVARTDHYVHTALKPGKDPILSNIGADTVTLVRAPRENCLQVVAVSERGRQSSVVEECVNIE